MSEVKMATYFNPPQQPDFNSGSIAQVWRDWKEEFSIFMEATEAAKKSDKIKVNMLLNLIGIKGRDIYKTFRLTEAEKLKLEPVITAFDKYVCPKKNITMMRFKFFTTNQKESQSMEDFIKNVQLKSRDCEFAEDEHINDSLIRDQIICGMTDKKMQEKLLRVADDTKLTLEKVITACRAHEEATQNTQMLNNNTETACLSQIHYREQKEQYSNKENNNRRTCNRCGQSHQQGRCSAFGKKCGFCNRPNHFESMCFSKQNMRKTQSTPTNRDNRYYNSGSNSNQKQNTQYRVKEINQTELNEEEKVVQERFFVQTVKKVNGINTKKWNVELMVNNDKPVTFNIDSGSDVNIMSKQDYDKLENSPEIMPATISLVAYNQTPIETYGMCKCPVKLKGETYEVSLLIADHDNIVGLETSEQMNLVKRLYAIIDNTVQESYKEVFGSMGCLEMEAHLYVKEDAIPVIQPPRKIPYMLQTKLKEELERMESLKVIDKVNEPTDWVSSLAIIEKPDGSLRVCLDPKPLNKAIKRQHYPLPTTEDIFSRMEGATIFSKLDASAGYWQIPVDNESSKLLTFNTPFGRYKFNRLPFGVHVASEIFQKEMERILDGIPGVANVQDDVIIWANNKQEHDQRLKLVLDRILDSGLRLNKQKCKFGVHDIIFLGHRITDEGIFPDPEKVSAINKMKNPSNITELQRFLGMVNYMAKFIPNMSEITAPLRTLLVKGSMFQINEQQIKAIQELKRIICMAPVLTIYDSTKPIRISSDASGEGLGAVLEQQQGPDWRPVAYASRSLTSTEKRYAQIEKECLSIVFACSKFHQYVYGREFTCENDHKPLQQIFKKEIGKIPARIQRMMMFLIKYPDLTLQYTPGTNMKIADTLSRSTDNNQLINTESSPEIKDIECQVHMIQSSIPMSNERLKELKDETAKDGTMQRIMEYVKKGWPKKRDECEQSTKPLWQSQGELTIQDGLLYRGEQLVIPLALRSMMKRKIHEGHLGITKCQERARTYFYWPNINMEIENMVKACSICQKYQKSQSKEEMIQSNISKPWSQIGCDIFHYGIHHYLIVTDYFSSYPEVVEISTGQQHGTSRKVIETLKDICARHGIPEKIISDGGPQFSSQEFEDFAKEWEFIHTPSSPEYPHGNAKVERSVQTVKTLIMKAFEENQDPHKALLAYRTSPLYKNSLSPAEFLMGRKLRTPLNSHIIREDSLNPRVYYDSKYGNQHATNLEELKIGDIVRVHENSKYKKWPRMAKVLEKLETAPRSYVVMTEDGSELRRNRVHLRKTMEKWNENILDGINNEAEDEAFEQQPPNQNIFNPADYRRFSNRPRSTIQQYGYQSE